MNWINAKDRLPENGTRCFLLYKNKKGGAPGIFCDTDLENKYFNGPHWLAFDMKDKSISFRVYPNEIEVWCVVDDIPKPPSTTEAT